MNNVCELIQKHRSIRKFKSEKIDQQLFESLILSGQAAASSSFLQAVTIIRVTDKDKRNAFKDITGGQQYVERAAEFLIFCADLSRPFRCCEDNGFKPSTGLTEQFLIATVDATLCAQNITIAAESVGLGICYIGAIRNDIERASELLNLPQNVYPVFGMCIGWPAHDPEVKPRIPTSVILKNNSYTIEDEANSIACYDEEMREYYKTRSQNVKIQGWSDQMVALLEKERRLHLLPFLKSKGFLKK